MDQMCQAHRQGIRAGVGAFVTSGRVSNVTGAPIADRHGV
jgi:hypothetical protein